MREKNIGEGYYSYWNQFVQDWVNGVKLGPRGLLNSDQPGDLSRRYIPEPWWGNDGRKPLYSVCLNLNPGQGDPHLQRRCKILSSGYHQYSDLFNILSATDRWHNNKRALPIRRALRIPLSHPTKAIENHLSIELIPWHTKNATSKMGYRKYIASHIIEIFNYSFSFAAVESAKIKGKLNSTVIFRFSGETAEWLFDLFKKNQLLDDYTSYSLDEQLTNPNVHARLFRTPQFPDNKFVAIWRSKGYGLNNFPGEASMIEILSLV